MSLSLTFLLFFVANQSLIKLENPAAFQHVHLTVHGVLCVEPDLICRSLAFDVGFCSCEHTTHQ